MAFRKGTSEQFDASKSIPIVEVVKGCCSSIKSLHWVKYDCSDCHTSSSTAVPLSNALPPVNMETNGAGNNKTSLAHCLCYPAAV